MPLGPLAIAGIAAGSQLLNTGVGVYAQGRMNRKTRKWNEAMYARQRVDALADWERQNEYNSPAAMMKRYEDVGLNKNLIYGQTNDAGPIRSTSMEAWRPDVPPTDVGVGAGLSAYYDMQVKQATIDNLKVQADIGRQEELLKASQILSNNQSIDTAKFDLYMKQLLSKTSVQAAELGVEKLATDIDLGRITFDQKVADIGATRAATHVTLNRDEREAAKNASDLREAAMRILNMRLQNAKMMDERMHIRAQIDQLRQSKDIKAYEQSMKEQNIYPGDSYFYRVLETVIQRLRGRKSSPGTR